MMSDINNEVKFNIKNRTFNWNKKDYKDNKDYTEFLIKSNIIFFTISQKSIMPTSSLVFVFSSCLLLVIGISHFLWFLASLVF